MRPSLFNGRGRVTETAFIQLCEQLSDHLWLQALLVTVGTCFLEDAARCGVSLLVAAGHIGWWMAFVAMTVGGMAGDVGLYLIGRYATSFLFRHHWVDPARLEWTESYFQGHAVKTVFFSRFLPGARTVTNTAAGAVKYPLPRFLLLLFLAAVVQSILFLQLGVFLGEKIMPYLRDTRLRFAIIAVVVLTGVLIHQILGRRRRQREKACPHHAPAGAVTPSSAAKRCSKS